MVAKYYVGNYLITGCWLQWFQTCTKYICEKLLVQRVLVAMVLKYVCGKLVAQRVLVAVVAKCMWEISSTN